MENYHLKITSNVIAGFVIAMGIMFFLLSCMFAFMLDDFFLAFIWFLLFSVPFLIWGFVIKGRKFMCNNEQFEAVRCVEELKNEREEIKVKIPQLTLTWNSVKRYSFWAGYSGGYIIVNTLDDKKYRIKLAYLKNSKVILEQFESRFKTSEEVIEQKKKQNTWAIVGSVIVILYFVLKFILKYLR